MSLVAGKTALDTSVAIPYLNGEQVAVAKVLAMSTVILPLPVVGELLFGAENSGRPLKNLSRYLQLGDISKFPPRHLGTL